MRQKLCVALSIAMLAYVGVVVSGMIEPDNPMIKRVGDREAGLVLGGGEWGCQWYVKNGVVCNYGTSGCTGAVDSYSVNRVLGGVLPTGTMYCGGACSTLAVGSGAATVAE